PLALVVPLAVSNATFGAKPCEHWNVTKWVLTLTAAFVNGVYVPKSMSSAFVLMEQIGVTLTETLNDAGRSVANAAPLASRVAAAIRLSFFMAVPLQDSKSKRVKFPKGLREMT